MILCMLLLSGVSGRQAAMLVVQHVICLDRTLDGEHHSVDSQSQRREGSASHVKEDGRLCPAHHHQLTGNR